MMMMITFFITDLNTCDESLTMISVMNIMTLQPGLLLDQIFCFANELPTSYVLSTIMFFV
jgi:hypothetical protein